MWVLLAACADRTFGPSPSTSAWSSTDVPVPASPEDTAAIDPTPTPSQWGSCVSVRSVVAFGGAGDQSLDALAPAPDGGRFASLHSTGPVTLGAGTPDEVTFTPAGVSVGVVARYDAADRLSWAVPFDGPYEAEGRSIAPLPGGGVVAESWCTAGAMVGGGAIPADCPVLGGWGDAWLLGLDASGTAVSSSFYGGPQGGPPGDLVAFPDGGVALVTTIGGDVIFGHGEPGETVVRVAPGTFDAGAVARFAPDGSLVWAQVLGGSESARPSDLVYDAAADALTIVGVVSGDGVAVFGTGPDVVTVDPAGDEVFVARFSSDGALQWIETENATDAEVSAVTVAADGAVTVAGGFRGVVTFGMGDPAEDSFAAESSAMWVARHAADGTLAWAASSAYDFRGSWGMAVATTEDDRTVVATEFDELLVLGGGAPEEAVFASVTRAFDTALGVYEPDGSFACGVQLANLGGDFLRVNGIAARQDGGLDVYGQARGTVRFGLGSADEVDLVTVDTDAFVVTIDVIWP